MQIPPMTVNRIVKVFGVVQPKWTIVVFVTATQPMTVYKIVQVPGVEVLWWTIVAPVIPMLQTTVYKIAQGLGGGTAYVDNCGTCDDNAANDCVQDCAGDWGGSAYFDECGTCDDIAANDCVPCEDININLISTNHLTCFESNDGGIEIEIIAPDDNYTIAWNNGGDSASLNQLGAGSHQVTVTYNDCVAFLEVTLLQPEALEVTISDIAHNPCEETDLGEALINITGGTAPYTILVDDVPTNQYQLQALSSGIYNVEINDANGCMTTTSFEIADLGCLEIDLTAVTSGNMCFKRSWAI